MVSRCHFMGRMMYLKGKVSREVVYNEKDKPVRIRKFEYNADGTKKKQYNYAPNGKLQSVKEFEYIR